MEVAPIALITKEIPRILRAVKNLAVVSQKLCTKSKYM